MDGPPGASPSTREPAVTPDRALKQYLARLSKRLDREGRAPTDAEFAKVQALREAADRYDRYWQDRGAPALQLPSWEELEDEFAPTADPPPRWASGLVEDVAKRIDAGKPTEGDLTQREIAKKHGVSRRQIRNIERELDPEH